MRYLLKFKRSPTGTLHKSSLIRHTHRCISKRWGMAGITASASAFPIERSGCLWRVASTGSGSERMASMTKSSANAVPGTRQGINDYTLWFASDKDMSGDYFGYDGSCPPWNDSIVHHYVFTLYALDVEKCGVSGKFTGGDVRTAIKGHVLAEAKITGLYSLNPEVTAPA